MLYFFFGFLFIFLDYPILLGYGGTLNASPDFLGYLLLLTAAIRLKHENNHFRRLTWGTAIALLLGALEFILDLLPFTLPTAATLSLDIVMTIASLYVAYEFAEGAKELERSLYKKLDADKLSSAWIILSMASLLQYLAVYMPSVALPCLVLFLLAVIWFESATLRFEKMLKKQGK